MKNISMLLSMIFIFGCSSSQDENIQEIQYNLIVNSSIGGYVNNPNELGDNYDGGTYNDGARITLIAVTSTGYEFTSWSNGSTENIITITVNQNIILTANFRLLDDDNDGISNSTDQCSNTPANEEVDQNGCSNSQKDTDNDGVNNNLDQDNNTRSGVPVDENGVMLNPIYLDDNGVTIRANEWAIAGDRGELNGITYLVIEDVYDIVFDNTIQNYTQLCTSKVTDLSGLFYPDNPSFNEDIGSWDVSNVTDMNGLFRETSFNQDISSWDVSNVTDFSEMFAFSSFNQDISNWNVSNAIQMDNLFRNSQFNQDISSWDVSNVIDMGYMFANEGTMFNYDISIWDVSNVEVMEGMFWYNSSFNQDLSNWNVTNVSTCGNFSQFSSNWTLPKPNFTNCTP